MIIYLLLFSHSTVYDSMQPHGLQHTRLPCPSPSPGSCSNSCIELVMPSNHLIFSHPLFILPSISSSIRVISNELALHIRWPKYWSFNFRVSPSNEYSGLISFRIDWFLSPCSPRDPQESSPTPQFKSINSLALVFYLTSGSYLTLTSIHDYWKNHSSKLYGPLLTNIY